jgi:hypothetical protein
MIYLFGTGKNTSIVYDGSKLTEAQKAKATVSTGRMPKFEEREGYIIRIQVDPKSHEIQAVYEKIEE